MRCSSHLAAHLLQASFSTDQKNPWRTGFMCRPWWHTRIRAKQFYVTGDPYLWSRLRASRLCGGCSSPLITALCLQVLSVVLDGTHGLGPSSYVTGDPYPRSRLRASKICDGCSSPSITALCLQVLSVVLDGTRGFEPSGQVTDDVHLRSRFRAKQVNYVMGGHHLKSRLYAYRRMCDHWRDTSFELHMLCDSRWLSRSWLYAYSFSCDWIL
jgi:hypothetical protein